VKFTFSKELIDIDTTNKPHKQLRLYKVFDDKNQLIGQYHHYPKRQIINFEEKEISIEVISGFLKKRKHFLIDKKDKKQVGEFEITGGFGINYFWKDVPSSPAGTIKYGNKLLNFRRIPTGINYSFLKPETREYFKFRLYATKGNEFYEYSLKIDFQARGKPYPVKYKPFSGTIESNSCDIFAILAGLYLMEMEFDFEDRKDNG
jgi:hypothetical protein